MALIPKTVSELRKYLETFEDDMPIFVEDKEGLLWWFSVTYEKTDPDFRGSMDILMISPFKVLNDWSEVS